MYGTFGQQRIKYTLYLLCYVQIYKLFMVSRFSLQSLVEALTLCSVDKTNSFSVRLYIFKYSMCTFYIHYKDKDGNKRVQL